MSLSELLEIHPGVTAVIGSGGKTTLLRKLGEELAGKGKRVLLCTTTKIYPFPGLPCGYDLTDLDRQTARLVCGGRPLPESGKLTDLPVPMAALAERFDYVLVEADGSAGRPLKAHAPHEPVIPPEANQTICLVGASGFGRPIREAAHRPERFAQLAECTLEALAAPETAAAVLNAEGFHQRVFINQIETESGLALALRMAETLHGPVLAGSLQREEYFICS